MIDERNINSIIELIDSSNQKIKTIKETIEEQKSTFELPKSEFKNLSTCVEEVLKSKNFDNVQDLFGNLNKNIAFKTDFLKEQYKILDENIFKVQNIAKHINKDITDEVNSLVEIVETFSYKIKILQGIVGDINAKVTSFSGENAEKFLKDFRSDCGDFDEEFDQVLRELKQNFKKASDITAKLSKLDTGVDLSKELFSINVSINAIMSSISIFDEKYKDLGKAFAESGLYSEFSAKIEDLSYNTKHLIRNIDNFNKVVEDGASVKEHVTSLEQSIATINTLVQSMNQEGFLEIKALLSSLDNSDDINEIKGSLNNLSSAGQNEKLDAIKEEIKESINALNQNEKFEEIKQAVSSAQGNNEIFEEIKTIVANLENVKILGQFETVLNEIQQGEKVSQEKLDELLKLTAVINFGQVEKEISFLSNDLEIISEEIKHSRSISDKSFSKMENIFESFNLTELKNRIFEFENHLKKFLKKEDLQLFSTDIQAISEKFELANSVIIDGFDDIESLKTYILGFEEKFGDLTNNIKNVLAENQEKFDSTIEAFDNTYKIDELINTSNQLMSQVTSSKDSMLTVLNDGQEKIELLIKAMDSSDKFDEMQETIKNNLDQIQMESNAKIQALGEMSKSASDDMEALKASMQNVIKENQDKFDDMLSSLDAKMNNQEILEQLESITQSIEEQSNNELQTVSNKLMDEVNNGKYLVIDTIRESQLKLEEFVASVDNAHRIEELKNMASTLNEELFKTKDSVISSLRDHQDRFELLIRALDDSDRIEEVNDLSKTIYSEVIASKDALMNTLKNNQLKIEEVIKLTDVNLKIDELEDLSKKIMEEVRFAKEITQNVGRSINPEALNDLQSAVDELKGSIGEVHDSILAVDVKLNDIADKTDVQMLGDLLKEKHEQLEYLIRAYDPTADISSIKDNLGDLLQQEDFDDLKQRLDANNDVVYELRSVLETKTRDLELLMKSVENTDDINELRDILFTIDNEQKEIKSSIEMALKSTDNADDINYVKGILIDIEQEQKDIKAAVESAAKYSDVASIKDSLSELVPNEEIYALSQKIDSNKDAMYELKAILEERTRNLELVMKSVENTDDISELKDILLNIDSEQAEMKNTVDFIAKSSGSAELSGDISELKDILFSLNNEQKDIKNVIESSLKSVENSDHINYVKGILADMEQEQKDIKTALDYVIKESESAEISGGIADIKDRLDDLNAKDDLNEVIQKIETNKDSIYDLKVILEDRTRNLELLMKSVETSDDISDLRDILSNINNEQKDIKDIIETSLKTAEKSDDINYLKALLVDMEHDQKATKTLLEQYLPNIDNKEVQNSLDVIESKLESISDIKDDISSLERGIDNLRAGFDGVLRQEDISNTFDTISEIRNDVAGFSNNINSLKKELEALSGNKDIEEAVEQLENLQYSIKESIAENASMSSNIASIESKIDDLKSSADLNYDFKTLLNNIQEDQLALKALVSSMDDDEATNLIKDQIRASEYAIRDVVEANRAKEDIEQLKYQVENLTQQIVVQVMQVFDNISFEQETQEIKEYVDESHNGVKNVLSVLKTNIERLLDAPKPIYIEELRLEIDKIAKNLDSIGPEMSEYVSTITSLRVSLEELAKAKDMVNLLDQNISNVSIEVDEILKISRDIYTQFDLIYTHNEAKDDFAKIRTALDNIIEKQQEQADNGQKEDLKGGIDNVNLSINYINENLNEFLGEYRIFQDKLSDTMHNLEGMASSFVQSDSINSEYKKGVSETFRSLKKDFNSVITTVGNLYTDITKVTTLTAEMLDTSARDKAEVLQNMQAIKELVETSDIDKLKDNFSTIIFSINGFMNNVDEKFASIIEDTKGAYDFASENKEITENIKSSIVHILEWTNTATRDFTRIQGNIEAFKDVLEESADDIRQINEIKLIVSDLDSALASRVEEVFDRQIQSKLDNQILPEFELLDKKIEKKLVQKLAPIIEAREQDKDELRFVINNQLSEETASLKELIDVVEKNIVTKVQHGFEQIFNQDLDFSPIVEKLDSEFAMVNDKLEDSLAKIDVELYQANVKIEDGLSKINNEFSSLSSNIENGLDKISKNVKNINFADVNSALEQGLEEISQKIDDTNLPQVITKIDDEFSAMNKKLDVDFFEMNKTVVDEFNLIEEKLDTRGEIMLQNIESSNDQLASEMGKFASKIESTTEKTFGSIDAKLDSQRETLIKNIESANSKLTSEMGQISAKIANQAEQAIDNIENIKTEIAQEIVQVVDKVTDKNQVLLQNIEEAKDEVRELLTRLDDHTDSVIGALNSTKENLEKQLGATEGNIDISLENIKKDIEVSLDKIAGKLNNQSVILKNIEETKEIISQLAAKSDTKSSDNMDLVLGNLEQAKESILQLAQNFESSNSTIEKSFAEILNSAKKDLSQEIKTVSGNNVSSILGNIDKSKDEIKLEFVQIVEKIDANSEKISKKLNSLEDTKGEILGISAKIEDAKNELSIISGKLDAQTGLVVKNVEDSNSKLDKTLAQVSAKLESQSKTVLKNLSDNQNSIEKTITDITAKIDTQTEIVFNNLGESKVELDEISKKITTQSDLVLKNIEESKEELEQELVQIIDKIDSQSENLVKAQDKKLKSFEEKLNEQDKKMQAIDEKLDVLIERLNTAQALDLSEIVVALENRMGSLDDNIKKIVSFVDEE